jgi:hypothetical protein
MDDWQRMAIYSESRLEDLKRQSKPAQDYSTSRAGRVVALFTALMLGLLIWWVA